MCCKEVSIELACTHLFVHLDTCRREPTVVQAPVQHGIMATKKSRHILVNLIFNLSNMSQHDTDSLLPPTWRYGEHTQRSKDMGGYRADAVRQAEGRHFLELTIAYRRTSGRLEAKTISSTAS